MTESDKKRLHQIQMDAFRRRMLRLERIFKKTIKQQIQIKVDIVGEIRRRHLSGADTRED